MRRHLPAATKRRSSITGRAVTAFLLLLLYGASAVPMIYWHDSGYMPDALQTAVKWFYAPLHWLVVYTTGMGNG